MPFVVVYDANALYPNVQRAGCVDGLETPTENFANIIGWLVKHSHGDETIRAIVGGNIYRVPQEIWSA